MGYMYPFLGRVTLINWSYRPLLILPQKLICPLKKIVVGRLLSNEKIPGWLDYIGEYTTQLYGDYNKPL